MKITTKTIYAIRAIHALNVIGGSGEHPAPVGVIKLAERMGVSNKYLEQIFTILKKNGFVRASSGKNGGYVLARKPEDIAVLDIIVLMDGPLVPVHCENNKNCVRCGECSVNWLWNSMKENSEKFLKGVNIANLSDEKFPVKGCE